MAETLVMLALSPTMEEGTIAKWIKKEGDAVAGGDVLCEVETDKASMEYESTGEGTLLKIVAEQGSRVRVGDPIGILGEAGEDIGAVLAAARPSVSPRAVSPAPMPASGVPARPAPPAAQPSPAAASAPGGTLASPLARRIAREKGIDIGSVQGSGPGGRVVKRDLERAAPISAPAPIPADGEETIRVSEKRRAIARRLTGSWQFAPHYYLKSVVNAGLLLEERARVNKSASEKVSLNAFIVKFTAEAVRRHPMVNASWQGETIVKHSRVDIALAVAQPDGLITPIVRDCERKGILEIDSELKALVEKARTNKLAPEEYTGSTFTISNLGTFGVREFTAVINPPEAAILAIGEIARQCVVDDKDVISMRPMMALTLSCDHRILDGAVAAEFMKTLKGIFEDPINLVL